MFGDSMTMSTAWHCCCVAIIISTQCMSIEQSILYARLRWGPIWHCAYTRTQHTYSMLSMHLSFSKLNAHFVRFCFCFFFVFRLLLLLTSFYYWNAFALYSFVGIVRQEKKEVKFIRIEAIRVRWYVFFVFFIARNAGQLVFCCTHTHTRKCTLVKWMNAREDDNVTMIDFYGKHHKWPARRSSSLVIVVLFFSLFLIL